MNAMIRIRSLYTFAQYFFAVDRIVLRTFVRIMNNAVAVKFKLNLHPESGPVS